jgi:tetratricopeptide (TPR) repeat protein
MDGKAPEALRAAGKKGPYPEAYVLAAILGVLAVGLTVFFVKRSWDEGVNRALGQAFAKSLQGASESVGSITEEDCERLLGVAGATLDLVAPPDEEEGEQPLRSAAEIAIATARREVRREGLLEAKLLDSALEELELRAEGDPEDPDRLADLALILILKLKHSGSEDEARELAARADSALDEALRIDGSLWRPRFYKASLSYLQGRRREAIRRFEVLLAAEERAPPERDEIALSHVLLGKLHLQDGSREKAREAWERGLSAFPGNRDLAERLSRLSGAR